VSTPFIETLKKWWSMPAASLGKVPAGIYQFRREAGGNITRFHLRVEDDGSGLLLANSSIAGRLSRSGVMIAKLLLESNTDEQIRNSIHRNFRGVDDSQFKSDLQKLKTFIETLANPEDNYPIFNLDDPSLNGPSRLMAPFHAQLRIAPAEQNNPLLKRLWDSGVMHVTFTASQSSDSKNALENVERAEDIGMICGVRGTAGWLTTGDLIEQIAKAGVDYIIVPLIFPSRQVHDAVFGDGDFEKVLKVVAGCKQWEICAVAEVPIYKENLSGLKALLKFLEENGIKNVQYYAIADESQPAGLMPAEIIQAALEVEELSNHSAVRYVWEVPVSRKGELKAVLEEGPRTAGDVSIRVEPDGSVFPPRGELVSAGNLLKEDWTKIWQGEQFRRYRERVENSTRCDICPGLAICAADCPGDPKGWDRQNITQRIRRSEDRMIGGF